MPYVPECFVPRKLPPPAQEKGREGKAGLTDTLGSQSENTHCSTYRCTQLTDGTREPFCGKPVTDILEPNLWLSHKESELLIQPGYIGQRK